MCTQFKYLTRFTNLAEGLGVQLDVVLLCYMLRNIFALPNFALLSAQRLLIELKIPYDIYF